MALSCIYLGLPYAAFFLGWCRWWIGWPSLILTAAAAFDLVRKNLRADSSESTFGAGEPFPAADQAVLPPGQKIFPSKRSFWFQAILWTVVCVLLVSLSGTGGVGLQEGDYFKHNAVLKHLIDSSWPVWIPTDQGPFPLVYYTAWYLPAAVVGQWFGWQAAQGFLFFWTLLGVMLALGWFALLVGRCSPVVLAVFFLFSAPDVVGAAWMKLIGWDPGPPLPPPIRDAWGINWYALRWWNWELRWWAGPYTWNYCSHMELLFWVPQQALGAWITTGMMVAGFWQPGIGWRRWALVPIALSALWSPLVTLGLFFFLLAEILAQPVMVRIRSGHNPLQAADPSGIFVDPRPLGPRVFSWFAWPNGAGLIQLCLMGLYYTAHFGPLPFSNDPRAEFRFLGFDDWPIGVYLLRLVFFWGIDVGAMVGLILLVRPPRPGRERILFGTAVGVLLGLALFRYGLNNDLGMRVSIPWLFLLGVLLAKGAVRRRLPAMRRWIFWGALAIMAATPIAEVYRHLCEMRRQGRWVNIPPAAQVQSLWELNAQTRQKSGNDFFIRQYIGRPDAPFFRYLAPPVSFLRKQESSIHTADTTVE